MVDKCANPACSEPFDYLQGQLYCCLVQPADGRAHPSSHGLQHSWLCELCSKAYTFEHRIGFGIVITPRSASAAEGQHRLDLRARGAA
jgi:hypothetical protein